MSRLVANLEEWRVGGAEWVDRLRDSIHLWNAVPIALVAVTIAAGGFWLGSTVGGGSGASAAPLTRTVRIQGEVITVGGVRYVKTPARVVRIRGRKVHVPARTVPLSGSGSTTNLPGQTVVVSTTVNGTSVATVVQTVTAPRVTVTQPASTVTGPTTTVQNTVTVPIISTVTITIP